MASIRNGQELPLYPMNGGNGPLSYVLNSSYQRGVLDVAKPIIEEEVAKKLEVKHLGSIKGLWIVDFGCSTGHNSFPAIDIIIEAISQKHESLNLIKTLEFYVFFNDILANDFNTLISSLPPHRKYHAAAVPGDFRRRLLPESSIHFAYSSCSLHWLTKVPKAVADRDSPAWNKGQIMYTQDRKEVRGAYLKQFEKDMESFLECRAIEMVDGGLMALILPGVPPLWDPQTEYTAQSYSNLLGSCLMDMANEGRINEEEIDSFNLPWYFATPQELMGILERSESFSIERREILNNPGKYSSVSTPDASARIYRVALEGLLTNHFGVEIIDELFHIFTHKIAVSPVFMDPYNDVAIMILVVLKRKTDEHMRSSVPNYS